MAVPKITSRALAMLLIGSACGAPDEAPETSFELLNMSKSDAVELAERVGQRKDCAPLTFAETEDEIVISCLSDVPLGQATDTVTVYCDATRGWIVAGGIFVGDTLGGAPITDCEPTDLIP